MEEVIRAEEYKHSPTHYAVALGDIARLSKLVSTLPRLSHPSSITSEDAAIHQDHIAGLVSSVLDRRDVPRRDTPLHLAVRLDFPKIAAALVDAGADPSLQNLSGWTPLQEALCLRRRRIGQLLLRAHRVSAWRKLRLRLPPLLRELRALPDFHLEISVRLESPLLHFLPRSAVPSDSIKLWKRDADLRADTSLAAALLDGGLRTSRRSPLSFLFLSSSQSFTTRGSPDFVPFGSLLILDRSRKEIRDAFDGADDNAEIECEEASACRPGIDITAAELVGRTNWRRKEKVEMVGQWKSRVYELQNVVFSFKTMKPVEETDVVPLEFYENEDDGEFLVADFPTLPSRHSCYEPRQFTGANKREEADKSRRKSVDLLLQEERPRPLAMGKVVGKSKEKEVVKSLRPTVWLTDDFPLKIDEFLPLLDILATKVKAVRRLRELLTTKFPPGTFPVKVAIPILPAVRVVFTFTKFTHFNSMEEFFTPLSSPRQFSSHEEQSNTVNGAQKSSWLKWKNNTIKPRVIGPSQVVDRVDTFSIPSDFTWISSKTKSQSLRKSKSRKVK